MKKVAIYARVSTLDQAEEGYSIEEQISKLTKYCEIKNWNVYDTYIDPGFTGSNLNRPNMKRLIKDVKNRKVDTILIYKLDRMSRSVQDTLHLVKDVFNKNDADFVSLKENIDTSTPIGGLFLTILSAIAEFEREQITERMQMGKVGRAKAGKAMNWSRPVFGYEYVDGEYVVNELEATVVKRLFYDYLSGTSITKLREILNKEGHVAKDLPWSYRTIRQTLDNPIHAGYIRFKGIIYPGKHEPIISKEIFDEVQVELEIRQKKAYEQSNNPRPFQSKYMLSGIIRCGHCGAPLQVVMGNKRKDGTRLKQYGCQNKRKRKGPTIYNDGKVCDVAVYHKMAILEEYILNQIEELQLDPDGIFGLPGVTEVEDYSETYRKQLSKIEKQIEKLTDLYLSDMMTLEQMKVKSQSLQSERKTLEEAISANNIALKENRTRIIVEYLKNLESNIKDCTYEEQRTIVKKLIKKVDVTKDKVVINWAF